MRKAWKALNALACMGSLSSSCSVLLSGPDVMTLDQRMAMIPSGPAPVQSETRIYWDEHAIPFIETQSDDDAAFCLGLVQAHLRLGQLELLRVISQGRISEVAGPIPFIKTLDQALRLLNFPRAAETSLSQMSPPTKAWLTQFTRGLNWYVKKTERRPVEHRLLQLPLKEFTESDILTIGKLVSADLNWGVYARFLKMAEQEGWEEAFKAFVVKQNFDTASFANAPNQELMRLIQDLTRSGSNSVVVEGRRTQTGSALIANDPHVGIFLPNFWFLAGVKSPSYHVVGLMIPGLPFFGLGRNPELAWGGTNMRAISSHLYDVSKIPAEAITTRKEKLRRRWWFDTEVTIRETGFGPIFTDLDYFDPAVQPFTAALQWIGQEPSDEIGSFLAANRARNWEQFVTAFQNYRVSAMNIVYADRSGNIGMLAAYGQPVLAQPEKTLELMKQPDNPIRGVIGPTDLPRISNPPLGLIASANNKPYSEAPIPLAYGYANNDRHDRMIELLQDKKTIELQDLIALQGDVFSRSAFTLKQALVDRLGPFSADQHQDLYQSFAAWDGHYQLASRGAVAFEILMYHAWNEYADQVKGPPVVREFFRSYDGWKPALTRWVHEQEATELRAAMQRWLTQSQPYYEKVENWSAFHRQDIQHPFGALPVLGSRFRLMSYGEAGSNDTLFKTGRALSPEPQKVTYGASARHISDLSDPDANYFVLKGGQDGWLNSPQLLDQVTLWREGRMIQMPLSLDKVRLQFKQHLTLLVPE